MVITEFCNYPNLYMKIQDITKIKIVKINRNSIEFTEKTHIWCTLLYPGHKNGCPNFNRNHLCPPNVELK